LNETIGLYIDRDSPLHRLNPLTKVVFTICIVILGFISPWAWITFAIPVLILIPMSFWGQIGVPYLRALLKIVVPLALILLVMQSLFLPGETTWFRFWFLSVEYESVERSLTLVSRLVSMTASFILFLFSTHPSRLMTDLTRRGVSPIVTYLFISTIQLIPLMRTKANTIMDAQRARGLETEGNIVTRSKALMPMLAPLVFGSLVDVEERAIAIEARAFRVPGKRTHLTIVPDSQAQHLFRIALIVLTVVLIGVRLWLSLTS
jgi:energy-coupling factor transport system permease protein